MRAPASRWAGFVAVSVLPAALAGAGCDWRDFDSIQAHTPVLAVGAPSHFPVTSDFGRYLLPLSGPASNATGGALVVSAAGATAVAVVNIDASGQPSGQTVSSPAFDPGAGNVSFPVTSMAEVPVANQVLLGVPDTNSGTGAVMLMTLGSTPTVAMFDSPPTETRFGLGVAAGQLAGGDAPELVVASADDLTVYLDGDVHNAVTAPSDVKCPLTVAGGVAQGELDNRPALVAPLMGAGGSQIVVGTPATPSGSVSVFTVDATSGVATCAFSYVDPGGDVGFGHALATGDFDADGVPDLLVGSPPGHAFWIRGPLTATSAVLPVTLSGGGGGALGASVAAVNLDGVAGDEAIVGAPEATVGGDMLAGAVHVVGGTMLGTELAVLQRHDPSANDAFGVEVHALPFCTSACGSAGASLQNLLLVGSTSHTFAFFQPVAGSVDPRTK